MTTADKETTMTVLMIINGSAYGMDSTFNAVRLAAALAKRDGVHLTVFPMGDGVTAAIAGQKTPDGYHKLDRMLGGIARAGGTVLCCGTYPPGRPRNLRGHDHRHRPTLNPRRTRRPHPRRRQNARLLTNAAPTIIEPT